MLRPRLLLLSAAAAMVAAAAPSSAAAESVNPPISGCAQVLAPSDYDELRRQAEDPLAVFERWRRDHHSMIEASPKVVCRHKAWLVLRGRAESPTFSPGGPEIELPPLPSSSTVGPNAPLAGGVTEYQGETAIAVNPNDAQTLVAGANTFYLDPAPACQSPTGGSAGTFGTQALYGSANGGASWTYNCAPWPSALTGGVPNATAWFGSDPAVAWDAAGNADAAYLLISADNLNNAGTAIVVAQSTDGGLTWPRANTGIVVNHISSAAVFDDKEMMAIDTSVGGAHSHTNRIYVIWDENNVERVAHADTVGGTWTTVAVGNGITQDIGGDIKVGADGTVYAIWNDVTNCPPSGGDITLFRKSTDGGTTWSAQETVFTHSLGSFCTNNVPPAQDSRGVNAFSSLGVDNDPSSPNFGRLYVATCDFPSGTSSGTDLNIYTVFSTDGGTTWPASSKVKVNDDTGTSATQFFPWLSVDPSDGSVNVSWYDTRNFTSTNTKTQILYAHSANGAVSYEPNVLVTDGGANFTNHVNFCDENSLDNLGANPNQYGDYSGMAALAQLAHPFWTDSRQFYPTSGDTRKEDGATATVTNACTPPPAPAAGNNGPICAGQTLSLTASTVAGATYSWTGPNGFTSSAQNPSIPNATAAAAGTYSVTATVSGCTSAAGTTTATINPLPSATITAPAGVCAGSTGNSASVPSAGTGATYTWTITNGSITSGAGTPAITFSAGGSGTLVLGVTVHTATGCSASGGQSLPITTQPSAPIAGNNGPICTGQTLQLTASTVAGASYSWTGPNGFTSALQNPSIAGATTATSGTYSVTAAVNGCASPAGTTAASVVANVATPVVTAPRCAAVGATGLLASVPANANTYQWSISGGTITTDPTLPQVSYDVGGPGTLATLSVVETLVGQTCPSDPGIAGTQVDFLDVPASSPFHDFICTIARDGITAGCGSGNFCPANVVLRSQMAVFLLRSEHGPAYTPPPAIGIFGDVPAGNPFAPWIERLYNEGITGGCSTNPLLYCPNNSVTRASMAVFLLVAQHGAGYTPPACTGVFSDVACPGAFTNWIEQLYHEAITGGCTSNPLRYCPANSVTRAQMAVFLTATFTLP